MTHLTCQNNKDFNKKRACPVHHMAHSTIHIHNFLAIFSVRRNLLLYHYLFLSHTPYDAHYDKWTGHDTTPGNRTHLKFGTLMALYGSRQCGLSVIKDFTQCPCPAGVVVQKTFVTTVFVIPYGGGLSHRHLVI